MRKWLKDKRKANAMSQKEIAKIVGIEQQSYSLLEGGLRNPSVAIAKKIADILDFDWTLFYEQPNQNVS